MTGADEPRDPDALIRRAKRGNPEFDQHFLVDDRVLDRLPGYLPESADRTHVLEIGGGTGALTDRLLAAAPEGGHVTVVERDPDLVSFLREEFAEAIDAGDLTVLAGDALDVDLPEFTASVSNLPYGASSEIAFDLLPKGRPLVLMFQQEFAERMVAKPGDDDYGRLSVSTQHYADVELVESIPAEAFDPQPRVQSAVVRCIPRDPEYEVDDEAFFLRFVKALFTQRRKTMRNAVRNTGHISGLADPDAVVDACESGALARQSEPESGSDAAADESLMSKRAGTVTPAEFAALAQLARRVDPGVGEDGGD